MSLRARLLAASLLLVVCGLLVADVATYSALRRFMYTRVDDQLQSANDSIQQALVRNGRFAIPQVDLVTRLVPGVFVQLRGPGDDVLIETSGRRPGEPLPSLPRAVGPVVAARGGDGVVRTVPATTGSGSYRALLTPMGTGSLVVALPLEQTSDTLHRLFLIEVLVTVVVVAAAAGVGLYLVRLGMRPLADIERTATAITGGDMSHRVAIDDERTEVGRVGRALNVMLDRIDVAFAERRRSEEAARASEQRVRRFVADASHELRTPVAAVRAYAELYRRGADQRPHDLARAMRSIEDEAARMGVLVDDLLLLTRLDEGRPLAQAPVDLGAVAADAVAAASAVDPDRPVSLWVEGSVEVLGDRDRLRQVVDNLLANVRAHTPAGAPADVAVRLDPSDGSFALLDVADRGPGLSDDAAAHVFERFYRADPSRARDGARDGADGGSGLGLSIVQAIASVHGGGASVSSRPGGGSVFTVRLPLLRDDPNA
jgi:two-component system OmpR family sensor kinase